MRPLCLHKTNRGFTLIELLVALVLGLVVLAAVLNIFVSQNRTNAVQQEVAYAQQNVRAALDLIVRDIRGAGYNPAGVSGFDGILAASGNDTNNTYIRIQSDLNEDGDTNDATDPDGAGPDEEDPNEDVTYIFDNANLRLRRDVRKDPTDLVTFPLANYPILVENVTGLEFAYELWDGTTSTVLDPSVAAFPPLTATERGQVRTVVIRLSVRTENPDPDTGQFRVRNLVSRVRIRNMGFQDLE